MGALSLVSSTCHVRLSCSLGLDFNNKHFHKVLFWESVNTIPGFFLGFSALQSEARAEGGFAQCSLSFFLWKEFFRVLAF